MNDYDENGFYIILPSNSPRIDDNENKPFDFRIDLPHQIQFKDKWEVALSEIIYPNLFNSLKSSEKRIVFAHRKPEYLMRDDPSWTEEKETEWYKKTKATTGLVDRFILLGWIKGPSNEEYPHLEGEYFQDQMKIAFPDRFYCITTLHFDIDHIFSSEHLEEFLNTLFPPWMKSKIIYNKPLQRFEIKMETNEGIILSKQMSNFIGFEKQRKFTYFPNADLDINALTPSRLLYFSHYMTPYHSFFANKKSYFTNLDNMFIYTDIVKYTFVGNSYVPLLRTIPAIKNDHNLIHTTFLRPYYIDLNTTNLSFIHIEIRNSQGDYIKFLKGNVVLTLHFKKKEIEI